MLLDLLSRLRITNPDMTDTLRLPMTQSQIADYLGLTNVYISKTFIRLEQEGFIQREEDSLRLLREDDMIELTDFHDRYADMGHLRVFRRNSFSPPDSNQLKAKTGWLLHSRIVDGCASCCLRRN